MTKTKAAKKARQARRHGHFVSGRTVYVSCPDCGQRVSGDLYPNAGSDTQQLDIYVISHLMYDCEGENR